MKLLKLNRIILFIALFISNVYAISSSLLLIAVDETDEIINISGVFPSINKNDAFKEENIVGKNGVFNIFLDGAWTFTANSIFNELNIGDNIYETFKVKSQNGKSSAITIQINGTSEKNVVKSVDTISEVTTQNENLSDESIEEILSMKSEIKADVGSRDGARNYLDSNTPIDVITSEQIEHSGLTTLVDVLRYFIAGFNAPVTSVADGSDHVQAYSLRGMSSDQLLVLVNGKRLHTSALLHVNGTIGRGSSHADLNTIAIRSIDRVEILRDGAAAQYGSDAISGVINVILKGMGHENIVSVHGGQRKEGDGTQLQADVFVSIPLKYDGFVNLTLDVNEQEQTQRAGLDSRLTPPSVQTHAGIPDSTNYKAVIYTEIPQENDLNIYSQILLNKRESEASTFFRPASVSSAAIYPNGFLPMIKAKIMDYSISLGIKGEIDDSTTWNLSNIYGKNEINYYVNNSMNYSLGASSPTSFSNGGLEFWQNTTTLDFKKSDNIFKVAGGIEYRKENYAIEAGDPSSYLNFGSQGFTGYTKDNEIDEDRSSYAIYVDSIFNFTKDFMFEVSLRYEDYSDFGESTNGKIAFSYDVTSDIMLRSSLSTGFRAPSLAQSYYSQTSSYVDDTNALSTQGTFRTDHEVSQSLGSSKLKSERSQHLTVGSVYQPNKNTSFTVDYFYINVSDKILLTPEISAQTAAQISAFAKYGISAARFFANVANTTTKGVDVKFNHKYLFANASDLDLSLWYHYNKNTLKDNPSSYQQSATIKTMFEKGQPRDSFRFLTNYKYKKLNTALNISRYGSYSQMQDGTEYKFGESWTTDLDLSYEIGKDFTIAVGGLNILNSHPDTWNGLSGVFYGANGIKQYSRYSPYGYSGAYYYFRASVGF